MMFRCLIAWSGFVLVFASPAWLSADAVYLTDGRKLEGTLKKTSNGWLITAPDGSVRSVLGENVLKVEINGQTMPGAADPNAPGAPVTPSVSADEKLASLLRAIETERDIDQIIQRLERFAAANARTTAAQQAEKEIETWRQRKADGLVKLGDRWVTPAERDELLSKVGQLVTEAMGLVEAKRLRDAEPIIARVLELHPEHISAQYLKGIVEMSQDNIIPAKKAFETVDAQIADHAPTLNNLAVIAFKQNQVGSAMSLYDEALAAAPLDQTIIDNVAEALAALDENQRRMPVVRRLERRFADQEAALAARMARENLFRWGATWVPKEQYEMLQAEERRIEQRVRELELQGQQAERDVLLIEDRIEATHRSLRRMEADRYAYSTNGRLIVLPYPQAYYDMQRDLDVLAGERQRAIAAVEAAKAQIREARQDMPVPRYTGVQRLIGVIGTPIESPPATQPTPQD